jgi:peptidoglycan-associated lipoprotein
MPSPSGPSPRRRALSLAALFGLALAVGACSANKEAADAFAGGAGGAGGMGGGRGAAAPGSPQDFAVNVGDRVFFETDSSDLTPTAVATLDKQASGSGAIPATPSSSRAMPTSAAPEITTIP